MTTVMDIACLESAGCLALGFWHLNGGVDRLLGDLQSVMKLSFTLGSGLGDCPLGHNGRS